MATKGSIVNGAYARLRISGLTVNASPEDVTTALDVMEDMCAEFEARNICLGYNFTDDPDPADDANVSREAVGSLKDLLAWRMAMFFGKQIPQSMDNLQRKAVNVLSGLTAKTNRVQASRRMPRGSGNTNRYNRWQRYTIPQAVAPVDCTTNFITYNGILDFQENVNYFLNGESITTYTFDITNGLTILSDSEADGVVSYRVECGSNARDLEIVQIEVTTDTGRKQNFQINFKCAESKIAVQ